MIEIISILFTVCCVAAQTLETKNPVLYKLTPQQIRDTFDNVMSDDYIKVLAKDFAAKAAQHFMKEMNKQKAALAEKLSSQIYGQTSFSEVIKEKKPERTAAEIETGSPQDEPMQEDVFNQEPPPVKPKDLLNSQEALRLLKEPSPDGDHLDSQSGELSGERDTIPVIEVMKINGNYFRRLLGLM